MKTLTEASPIIKEQGIYKNEKEAAIIIAVGLIILLSSYYIINKIMQLAIV